MCWARACKLKRSLPCPIHRCLCRSRSPAIHNAALQQLGLNAVYVPLLVDDMAHFLATFTGEQWQGDAIWGLPAHMCCSGHRAQVVEACKRGRPNCTPCTEPLHGCGSMCAQTKSLACSHLQMRTGLASA